MESIREMIRKSSHSMDCLGKRFVTGSQITFIKEFSSNNAKSRNGGDYSFYEYFSPIDSGTGREDYQDALFYKTYGTSSEFDYCPVKGVFTSDYSDEEPETITAKELLEYLIENSEGNDIIHEYWSAREERI